MKLTMAMTMSALTAVAVANPLGVNTYEQTFKVTFADSAAAERAKCEMTRLPDGAAAMLSARWDDPVPQHVAKVQMLKGVGVKSTIYVNRNPGYLQNEAKQILALGNAIGNHTATHPFMMEISANRDFAEILLNRIDVETNLNQSCVSFAAPFGWCSAIDDAKPVLVSDLLFNTGHYVSGDNLIPETKGGEKKRYPTRLVRSGDSKIVPSAVAKSFADALDWIAKNPRFPRMSYGIHSWCDAAGNELQAQTIRTAWRDDWCTGTDLDYGAYSYQYDYGKVEKVAVEGDTATFRVTRCDPRPLGAAIPLSLKFSEMPKATTLARGKRGTFTLPHDPSHRAVTKIGTPLSAKFPKIDVRVEVAADALKITIVNGSSEAMKDVFAVAMLPPKWRDGRSVFGFASIAPGSTFTRTLPLVAAARKDYAYGPADYACSVDFDYAGEACRIWALAQDAGVEPPKQLTPSETVKSIGAFDVAKLDSAVVAAMSVPGAALQDVGTAQNEVWGATGKKGGAGFTVHFWPDFMYHPKDRLAYRDAVDALLKAKRQARLFAYDFVADADGTAKLYASTDRGLPKVTPMAWVNGQTVKLGRKVVNAIPVKKGVNRLIVRIDQVQTRWPESVFLVVCRDGLDTPFPAVEIK